MKEKLIDYLKGFLLQTNWEDEHTPEQARAIFATTCLVGNIDVDTAECDNLLLELYNSAALDEVIKYNEFENFMIDYIC